MPSLLAAAAAALMLAASARPAEVVVFPVNAVNLSAAEADAIGTVLAGAYADASGQEVVLPREAGAALREGNASAAARSLGAREYIELTAVGLASGADLSLERDRDGVRVSTDGRIIVQAKRFAANGDLLYSAQMTAGSLGDIETVAIRLARALHDRRPVEDTMTIRTVTRREATAENRTFTERIMGLKTQMLVPLARGMQYNPLVTFGFDGRLEGRNYFLEIGAGLALPTDTGEGFNSYGGLYAELGGSFYLSEGSTSPYVGVGIEPRLVFNAGTSSPVNVAAYGQLGLMFLRHASTRIYADLRVAQNLTPLYRTTTVVDEWGYEDTVGTGDEKYPTEVGVQVGIGW